MWNLEYELIAILLITATIGLFMGRFLCKSGETEEKIKKSRIITSYKSLQVDFNKSEERLAEQVSLNQTHEDTLAQQAQEIVNLTTQLNTSDKHSAKHLEELKVLEKYKTRFEALSSEFEIQNKQIESLKDEKSTNIESLHSFETNTRILEQNFSSLSSKYEETTLAFKEIIELSEEQKKQIEEFIMNERELLGKLENHKIDKEERLHFLEEEYDRLISKLNILIEEKEDLTTRIRAISSVVGAVGVEEESVKKEE